MAKVIKTLTTDLPAFKNSAENFGEPRVPSISGSRSDADRRNDYYGKTGKTKDPKDTDIMPLSSLRNRSW